MEYLILIFVLAIAYNEWCKLTRPKGRVRINYTRCREVLGVAVDADEKELNEARKRMLMKYHPDKVAGDDEKIKEYTKETHRVNQAHKLLLKRLKATAS